MFCRSRNGNPRMLLRVSRLRSTTKERFLPARRSAQRKGAQPVIMGVFAGLAVHHVGNQSSCVRRKLMFASDRAPDGLIVSQKRSRKSSVTRMTFPISNLSRASFFWLGNSGVNRTAPV